MSPGVKVRKGRAGWYLSSFRLHCLQRGICGSLDNSNSEKYPDNYSPWETKQNKTPPHSKILKRQQWQMRSQLISFFRMTENHSRCWINSLRCHGPIRKFLGNFEAILAPALRTRDKWSLSSRAKPHLNSRDRKSPCSFIYSSECWLGFYRLFTLQELSL